MPRKKSKNSYILLTRPIILRVNENTYKRLENILANSNCRSIGEVARNILSREKILMLTKDVTMNAPLEELSSIRKELKAIGIFAANGRSEKREQFLKENSLNKEVTKSRGKEVSTAQGLGV